MRQTVIRIATRKSPLALRQAEIIREALQTAYPELIVEIKGMLSQADKLLATPLAKIGGKGLFIKELEQALLDREADIAVHSMKDVPSELLDDFVIVAVSAREDPRDVLVTRPPYRNLDDLPRGAYVGTSSVRRQCQLKALRPDLVFHDLRGNVGTRLRKLDEGEFDAIVLAAAGLVRLNLSSRITAYFSPEQMIPGIGQGALGIECRSTDTHIHQLIQILDDMPTHSCMLAERAVNRKLGGSCQTPIAAFATLNADNYLHLTAMIGSVDGQHIVRGKISGHAFAAEQLGEQLADELLNKGGREILQALERN